MNTYRTSEFISRVFIGGKLFRKGDCREKLKTYFMHYMPQVFLTLYGFRGM